MAIRCVLILQYGPVGSRHKLANKIQKAPVLAGRLLKPIQIGGLEVAPDILVGYFVMVDDLADLDLGTEFFGRPFGSRYFAF